MANPQDRDKLNAAITAVLGGWAPPAEAYGTPHEEELVWAYGNARVAVADAVEHLLGFRDPDLLKGAVALLDACARVDGPEDDFWRVANAVRALGELKGSVYGFEAFGPEEDDDGED